MNTRALPIVIVAGLVIAITRGWSIFIAFPFWVVATVIIIYCCVMLANTKKTSTAGKQLSSNLLTYSLLATYIATLACVVAGGDTPGVWAFGFITVDASSSAAHLSSLLSQWFGITFVALALGAIFEIQRRRWVANPKSPAIHRIFLISFGIITCIFIYSAWLIISDGV